MSKFDYSKMKQEQDLEYQGHSIQIFSFDPTNKYVSGGKTMYLFTIDKDREGDYAYVNFDIALQDAKDLIDHERGL